jgi:hypothetical protein
LNAGRASNESEVIAEQKAARGGEEGDADKHLRLRPANQVAIQSVLSQCCFERNSRTDPNDMAPRDTGDFRSQARQWWR